MFITNNIFQFLTSVIVLIFFSYCIFSFVRIIFVMLGGFFVKTKPNRRLVRSYYPLVSVLVPAWNEEVGIRKTLNSVYENTYKNLQVISINDGSTDNTLNVLRNIQYQHPDLLILDQPNSGKAAGLNNGIKHARGEIVITLDADSYLYPDAIVKVVRAMSDHSIDVVSGRIIVGNTKNFWGLIQFFEFLVNFHYKKLQSGFNSIYVVTGAFAAYRKSALEVCGDFDGTVKGEDLDYSLKACLYNLKTISVNEAICVTEGPNTLAIFIKQRTRWKWCALQCYSRYSGLLWNRNIKSKVLTYFDLPMSVMFGIEQLLWPLIIFVSILYFSKFSDFSALFFFSYLLPVEFFLLLNFTIPKSHRNFLAAFVSPLLFVVLSFVEFIAFYKALKLIFGKKEMKWEHITRLGLK